MGRVVNKAALTRWLITSQLCLIVSPTKIFMKLLSNFPNLSRPKQGNGRLVTEPDAARHDGQQFHVPLALYGCKTWSHTLGELKRGRKEKVGENYLMKSFMICRYYLPNITKVRK